MPFLLLGQEEEFERKVLDNPTKFKKTLLSSFTIQEIPVFKVENQANRALMENGYAKSQIINPEVWKALMKDNIPVAIDVIYTKYPKQEKDWLTNYHTLLANRLKALFEIDPSLNSIDVTWNIILQTECNNAAETKKLFHGIAIHYISKKEQNKEELLIADTLETEVVIDEEEEIEDNNPVVEEPAEPILEDNDVRTADILEQLEEELPDEIAQKIKNKPKDEAAEIILKYYEENEIETKREDITPDFIKDRSLKIERFIEKHRKSYSDDISKALDRQKDWDGTLVVMDWTGSMYAFGGEVMKWHLLNFQKSKIESFVLFNDGDAKDTYQKTIGETGGIYMQKATNIDQLLRLFELVMARGGGGDRPENDLEAIVKGLEKFPNTKQVILIADNRSCVRDMPMLDKIKVPVKVILCGYSDQMGANPDYIQIAAYTGGSVHTAEEDIVDLKIELLADEDDLALTRDGKTILTIRSQCQVDWNYYGRDWVKKRVDEDPPYKKKVYYSMNKALANPDSVYRLELSVNRLESVPKEVENLPNLEHANFSFNNLKNIDKEILNRPNLQSLDLKRNEIRRINKDLFKLETLLILDLSHNKISKLPKGFEKLNDLQELYLHHNEISKIPKDLPNLKRLRILDLNHNEIKKLPEGYSGWRRLEQLNISYNQIKSLPTKLKVLKRIRYFDASHNQIETPPNAVVGMRRLTYLDLSYNNIVKVPSGIGNLKQLEKLNLSHNKIEKVHRRLMYAPKLVELDLSYNNISKLPDTLYRLKKLKTLNLTGNPISEKELKKIKKTLPKVKVIF